jgi:hypothetical protein
VHTFPAALACTIEPDSDALSIEEVDELQRLGINSFVQTIRNAFVQQVEPAKDAVGMEEVVEVFSVAFEQTCTLKVVYEFTVNGLTTS